jgi:hypothetical protein
MGGNFENFPQNGFPKMDAWLAWQAINAAKISGFDDFICLGITIASTRRIFALRFMSSTIGNIV